MLYTPFLLYGTHITHQVIISNFITAHAGVESNSSRSINFEITDSHDEYFKQALKKCIYLRIRIYACM